MSTAALPGRASRPSRPGHRTSATLTVPWSGHAYLPIRTRHRVTSLGVIANVVLGHFRHCRFQPVTRVIPSRPYGSSSSGSVTVRPGEELPGADHRGTGRRGALSPRTVSMSSGYVAIVGSHLRPDSGARAFRWLTRWRWPGRFLSTRGVGRLLNGTRPRACRGIATL